MINLEADNIKLNLGWIKIHMHVCIIYKSIPQCLYLNIFYVSLHACIQVWSKILSYTVNNWSNIDLIFLFKLKLINQD